MAFFERSIFHGKSEEDFTEVNSKTDWTLDYYDLISNTSQLKTNACCTLSKPASHIRDAISNIHENVTSQYYGCGLVVPEALLNCKCLDLGCGCGRDCYILSQLVGENGQVVGIDMTDSQLKVAKDTVDYHTKKFNYKIPNIRFVKGYIERMDYAFGLDSASSFDIIVSNCVVNLSPDKRAVLQQAYKFLKEGGEMYFSDVYADRRVPVDLEADKIMWGECLSGALYYNDFLRLAKECGFTDPRLVSDKVITINNKELEKRIGGRVRFYSATYRLFKLKTLEPDCEDYGQAIEYKGTIDHLPNSFELDAHHCFPTGKILPVCGNTYRMLHETRFKEHFKFYGTFDVHYGLFEGCGKTIPFASSKSSSSSSSSDGGCC